MPGNEWMWETERSHLSDSSLVSDSGFFILPIGTSVTEISLEFKWARWNLCLVHCSDTFNSFNMFKSCFEGAGGNLWVSQFSLHLSEASVSLPSHQPKVHLSFRTVRKPGFFWILPLFLQENQKELSFAFLTSKFWRNYGNWLQRSH